VRHTKFSISITGANPGTLVFDDHNRMLATQYSVYILRKGKATDTSAEEVQVEIGTIEKSDIKRLAKAT